MLEPGGEAVQRVFFALGAHFDRSVRQVPDPADHALPARGPHRVVAEGDPLDTAANDRLERRA